MRPAIAAIVPIFFLVAACDTETDPYEPEARQFEQPAEQALPQKEAPQYAKHHKRGMMLERLCTKISCDDDQRAAITALFESAKSKTRPDRAAMGPANEALADAFRTDSFSGDDLAAYHNAATQLRGQRFGTREAIAVELHGILTPAQRNLLADKVAEGGHFPFGRGGRHFGRWDRDAKGQGDLASNERVAEKRKELAVEVACARLECSDDQRVQIAEIMNDRQPRGEGKREAMQKVGQKLADAFRGEDFSEDDMTAHRATANELRQRHMQSRSELIVRMHGVLTPEQREKVATKIEKHGPRGLLGDRQGRGGKHGKRGGHRGHRGPWGKKGFDAK